MWTSESAWCDQSSIGVSLAQDRWALAIVATLSRDRKQQHQYNTATRERASERSLGVQYIDSRATLEVMQVDEI